GVAFFAVFHRGRRFFVIAHALHVVFVLAQRGPRLFGPEQPVAAFLFGQIRFGLPQPAARGNRRLRTDVASGRFGSLFHGDYPVRLVRPFTVFRRDKNQPSPAALLGPDGIGRRRKEGRWPGPVVSPAWDGSASGCHPRSRPRYVIIIGT